MIMQHWVWQAEQQADIESSMTYHSRESRA